MSKSISITYYGAAGHGPTVTAAKQDAGRKIAEALSGSYTPVIIRHGEYTALVWRVPMYGWCYKLLTGEEQGPVVGFSSGGPDEDLPATLRQVERHLAQLTGTTNGLNRLTDADLREAAVYASWQLAYRQAREAGQDDEAARQTASRAA